MKEEQEAVSSPDRVAKGESEMEEEEEAIRVIILREKGIVALVKWWVERATGAVVAFRFFSSAFFDAFRAWRCAESRPGTRRHEAWLRLKLPAWDVAHLNSTYDRS